MAIHRLDYNIKLPHNIAAIDNRTQWRHCSLDTLNWRHLTSPLTAPTANFNLYEVKLIITAFVGA